MTFKKLRLPSGNLRHFAMVYCRHYRWDDLASISVMIVRNASFSITPSGEINVNLTAAFMISQKKPRGGEKTDSFLPQFMNFRGSQPTYFPLKPLKLKKEAREETKRLNLNSD